MFTLNCKGKLLQFDTPIVMGIINTTPDSFYAGSRQNSIEAVVRKAEQMIAEGASILDIGGQSTRPGSEQIGAGPECEKVIPVIEALHSAFPDVLISIDTFHATVAQRSVEAGACLVNDISGGNYDQTMLDTVAKLKVPYICMHMRGTPRTMQQDPHYKNVTSEVLDHFIERTKKCLQAGINDMIIDPGFGFGKTIEHNFQLLRDLPLFRILEKPLLLGVSRKSTIYRTLGITAEEALNGTTVLNTLGLLNGANILRVHDVKEAIEAIKLVKKYGR